LGFVVLKTVMLVTQLNGKSQGDIKRGTRRITDLL